jgi:hypothetical protein
MSVLSPLDIERRLEDAAQTLKHLPNVRVPGYFSTWPEIVRRMADAEALASESGTHDTRGPRITPTPRAISEMEECFEWLLWLDPVEARIVWLRAMGKPWRHVCARMTMHRQTAWRRWAAALITISRRLAALPKAGKVA